MTKVEKKIHVCVRALSWKDRKCLILKKPYMEVVCEDRFRGISVYPWQVARHFTYLQPTGMSVASTKHQGKKETRKLPILISFPLRFAAFYRRIFIFCYSILSSVCSINYGYCITANELPYCLGVSVTAKPVQYAVIIICIQSNIFYIARFGTYGVLYIAKGMSHVGTKF